MNEDSYAVTIDHSQYGEIRKTKNGKIFVTKNIRLEFKDNQMILNADISGDEEAASQYLKAMSERIVNSLKPN